jgi:HK97 family phage major capsid protein
MSKQLRELQARKAKLVNEASAITKAAADANRDLTAEEQTQFDAIAAKIRDTNAAITREEFLIEQQRSITVEGEILSTEDNAEKDMKRGYKTFGEFAQAVRVASQPQGTVDSRLLIGAAAPTTFGGEGVGQDGGFAVPPDFAREIWTMSLGEDSFLPLTDNTELGNTNSMVFPKDETVPWGTDGIRAYWQVEAAAATATKPKLGLRTLRLHKLMALVPLTDELIADQNALGSYLPSKIADSIRWKVNEAILFGNGNGQPAGLMNSAALIVVAKESGQATLTLQVANVAKMVARLPAGSFGRAVWLLNNDVLPALFTLTLGNYPIYLPMNQGAQYNPFGTLLGRPIIVSQHAASFTNQGDIALVDFKFVQAITKAGGMQSATSMHLYFDADATAFRTTFRVDTQSKIAAALNPAKGSNTLSPFVTLQAR